MVPESGLLVLAPSMPNLQDWEGDQNAKAGTPTDRLLINTPSLYIPINVLGIKTNATHELDVISEPASAINSVVAVPSGDIRK